MRRRARHTAPGWHRPRPGRRRPRRSSDPCRSPPRSRRRSCAARLPSAGSNSAGPSDTRYRRRGRGLFGRFRESWRNPRRPGLTRTPSAFTAALAISSCTANTSSRSRSNRSDQRWMPSVALIRREITRSRLPAARTLPSSTVPRSASMPIRRTSSSVVLNRKAELSATTRKPGTPISALMISSAIPWQKNSRFFSGVMSTKGSTAMEGQSAGCAG